MVKVSLKYLTMPSLGYDVFEGSNGKIYVDKDGEIFTASAELYEPIEATGVHAPSAYTLIGYDDWSQALYRGPDEVTLVGVDGYLHTRNDWDEPIESIGIPIPKEG